MLSHSAAAIQALTHVSRLVLVVSWRERNRAVTTGGSEIERLEESPSVLVER